MNAKALIPLLAGLGIAGLAAKLGLDFVRKAEAQQTRAVKLWTPVQDIKRGVAITEAMIRPLAFPAALVPPGALSDAQKIVGRVPHTGAPAGVPILESMLLPPGAAPGVQVPPGLRAVAVKIDESSGVDYHLEPGCRVDVVGVFTIRTNNRSETLAKTILEDVEVAAVGERLAPESPGPNEGPAAEKGGRRERPARAVTLLVKPEQVPTLHLAEQKGKIKLAMRGTLDDGRSPQAAQVSEAVLLSPPQEQTAAADTPQPSWRDRLNELVSTFWQRAAPPPPAEPAAAPEPAPVEAAPAPPAWTMVIYLGEERKVLGWDSLDSFQPFELSAAGPNIFQDEPQTVPPRPKTRPPAGAPPKPQVGPARQVEPQPQSEPASEPPPESDAQPEPEELFE